MKITKELVKKIEHILSFGLTKGLGKPVAGEMCVEAAICFALGEPHTDSPSCVGDAFRKAKIDLNDCNWSSKQARAKGMKKLAIAQLGSNQLNQKKFFNLLKLKSMQRILPYIIQKHYDSLKEKDSKLLEYKNRFESLSKIDNDSLTKFYNNYYHNYHHYNYDNYYYCYCDFNYSYCYCYNYLDFGDEYLLLIADTILQTAIELKSPGCKYLHLLS